MRKEINHEIISHIGILTDDLEAEYRKEINTVSWNGRPASIEIRTWKVEADGNNIPLKGITFTQSELITLRDILNGMHFGADSDRNYEVEHVAC